VSLALRSLHDLPSATGVIDRRYPFGDAPVIVPSTLGIDLVAFNAAAYNLSRLAANQTFDFNYRQFLTGTSKDTAVLTVNAASGSTLGNWRVDASGNGISIATGANGGSGSLFVSANNGVDPTVSFPVQPWSALAVVQTNAVKLVTGNGFWFDNQFWSTATGTAGTEQTVFNQQVGGMLTNSLLKYVYLSLTWGAAEGPTRGDYSKAFAAIDAILAKLATANHKMGLILEIWQTFFNTLSTTDLSSWPQYVVNNNWVNAGVQQAQKRTQLKWDIDDVWTAYNAMCTAILDRYNNHPLFLGFSSMDESEAISRLDDGTTWINSTNYCNKYLAQQLLLKDHAPNTLIYVPFNYLPPGDATEAPTMANMIRSLLAKAPYGYIMGGPDPFLRQTTFQKLVAGLYQSTTGMGDIRSQLLLMNRTQEAFLNKSTPTPTTNYDTALANNAVCLTWNCETWLTWKYADQLATISAHNGAVGTPPPGNYIT